MVLALQMATPLLLGLVQGAGVGLVAIGLVLIYKSSRVFNFVAGEFATVGAFATYVTRSFMPFPLAALCGVVAGLVVGVLTERFVVRPLDNRPKVTVLVATAALAISLIAVEFIADVHEKRIFPARALWRGNAVKLFGVIISNQRVLIILALAAAGGALAYFFARTDLGLATQAASQELTASRLMGIRPNRIAMMVWGTAGALGGLAGVLLPPLSGNFNPAYGTTDLLIPAFTAAVLGGMTSVPGAFAGGLLLGIVQNMAQFNISSDKLPGAPAVFVLVVLVGVLVVRPAGLLGKEA